MCTYVYYLFIIISATMTCSKYCGSTKDGTGTDFFLGIPGKFHKEGDIWRVKKLPSQRRMKKKVMEEESALVKPQTAASRMATTSIIRRRRHWHPTPVHLPGKSHGRRSLGAAVHGVAKSQTWLSNFTKIQREGASLQTKKRGIRRKQPCWPPWSWTSSLGNCKKRICKPPGMWYFALTSRAN